MHYVPVEYLPEKRNVIELWNIKRSWMECNNTNVPQARNINDNSLQNHTAEHNPWIKSHRQTFATKPEQ